MLLQHDTREEYKQRIESLQIAQKPRASSGSPGWGLWRWGESNPRPAAGPEFFSERSLRFYFSAPSIAQTHRQIGSVD